MTGEVRYRLCGVAVLNVIFGLIVPTQADPLLITGRGGFDHLFQPDQQSLTVDAGYMRGFGRPNGLNQRLRGYGTTLSHRRFSSPSIEKGLECGWYSLDAADLKTKVCDLTAIRRDYFEVRPHHAFFWQAGIGFAFLTELVPDQAAHMNFSEHLGAGIIWRTGKTGLLSAQYRVMHISNGGREEPNGGLDFGQFRVGYAVSF